MSRGMRRGIVLALLACPLTSAAQRAPATGTVNISVMGRRQVLLWTM